MTFKQMFISSVGKKLVMGFTGLFLVLFLVVHVGLNASIWANDGGEMFKKGAHFMGANWVPRLLEVGLFAGLILHIIQGFVIEVSNRSKRSVKYNVGFGNSGSKWYSRSMGLLGVLILIFLVLHLSHFWIPNRSAQGFIGLEGEIDLYKRMKETFSGNSIQVIITIAVYVLGCAALGYHLAHGVQSACRTFGLSNNKWVTVVTTLGYAFAIIVPLMFALMPLSFHFGWIE